MEPNQVGRLLGVGARIAAKTLRERAAAAGSSASRVVGEAAPATLAEPARGSTPAAGMEGGATRAAARPIARVAAVAIPPGSGWTEGLRRLARGAGRFVAALLHPFARAGYLLWLQISGVFFGIFAVFFLVHAGQTLHAAGWRDRHAEVYAGLGLLFAWFTVSSFWRARRKGQRR
jgi:hypothetical protein